MYPLIEGSTKGAGFSGGYVDTLNVDSQALKVGRRGDGTIWLEASFRNLPTKGKMTLVMRRSYPSATGSEAIQLYNWASASYPYGGFDTFSSAATLPTSSDEVRVHIPNIAPYVDFDGTAYLKVLVSGASSGNELRLDQAYLQKGYR